MSAQTETPQAAVQQQEAAPVQLVLNIQLPNPADPNQALSMEELQKQIALQVAALTANPQFAVAVAPAQTQLQAVCATEQTAPVTQAEAHLAGETNATTAAIAATPAASSDSSTVELQAAAITVQPVISTTPAASQTTSSAVQTETTPAATPAADVATEQPTATIAVQTTTDEHATVNTEETTTTTTTAETATESSTEVTTVSDDNTASSTASSDSTSEAVAKDATTEEEATSVPEKKVRPPGDGPRKRALIIGINYIGTSNALNGCIQDAQNIQELLKSVYGYVDDNIRILTDDQDDTEKIPTKENIFSGINWLLDEAKANDAFFFYFSGHGTTLEDTDGDEVDGQDEAICPSDVDDQGCITDDELNAILVRGVPHGARLAALFDSCHSGSVMDLPYMYSLDGKVKSESLLGTATKGLLSAGLSYMNGETTDMYNTLSTLGSRLITTRHKEHTNKFTKSTKADVIMFSGCRDDQYSYTAFEENKDAGALTYSFIKSLKENPNPTYRQLLKSIREKLHIRYQQLPEFSSSHEVDFDTIFAA